MKILKKKLPGSLVYLSAFAALSIVMTNSGSGKTQQVFESATLSICIFDEDNTEASRALAEYIGQTHEIIEIENDRDRLIDSLYYMSIDYALVINDGYSEKLAAGETDDLFGSYKMHGSYGSVFMEQFLNEYTTSVSAYMAGGAELSDAIASAEEALSLETEVTMASYEAEGSASEFPVKFSYYFKFLSYILISVILSALAPVLLVVERKDIRFRTNCSSVKANSYTMQIFAGSAVFIAVLWLLFMLLGMILYGGMYQGRVWIAVLNSFIFALISVAITIFISSFQPDIRLVTFITQIVGLGMSFLCGVFVDQSLLGEGVLAVARFLPMYWYVRVNDMLAGVEVYDVSKIVQFMAIEALFAVVLAIITLLVRRLKYSEAAILSGKEETQNIASKS